MGVLTGSTGPNFLLPWARAASDGAVAPDYNRAAHLLEYLCQAILEPLFEQGIVMADAERCQFNATTKRITAPGAAAPIMGIIGGRPFRLTSDMEESGTATAGGTTYVRDTGLANSDEDFWQGGYVVFTSGANNGLARAVSAFNNSTKQLSWTTPLGSTVSVGDTYVVTMFYVSGLTNSIVNYIYVRETSKLNGYGIPLFVATATDVANDTDLLIATATLDGSGVVTASDNSPTGARRLLYPGIGRHDTEVQTYVFTDMEAGSVSLELTITHETYDSCPGRVLSVAVTGAPDTDVEVSVTESWRPDQLKIQLENVSEYTRSGVVTVTITGRQLQTL